MSYKEWRDSDGCLVKEWRNDASKLHREDGPAWICYDSDGLIIRENFYINEHYLGAGSFGFWALWERLTEEGRQALGILKCLAMYS